MINGIDIILETNAAVHPAVYPAAEARPGAGLPPGVESVRQAYDGKSDRPRPEWVRGTCPQCGSELVSNCYYVGGRGFLVLWECWESLKDDPACVYRKVL